MLGSDGGSSERCRTAGVVLDGRAIELSGVAKLPLGTDRGQRRQPKFEFVHHDRSEIAQGGDVVLGSGGAAGCRGR